MASTTNDDQGLQALGTQPRGGSTGVSFDWGFALSLTLTGAASLAGYQIGPALPLPVAFGALVLAAVMVVQGEALRRGSGLARRIQIGFHSLLVVLGLATIFFSVQAFQQGQFDMLYTLGLTLILTLGVSPAEIWLLLQPGSRRWYGNVDPKEASKRHSGRWLVGTVLWAVVGGVLQAVAP